MKLNWCCKLRTAPSYYGEFSYFSILLQVPSKLWGKRIMWEYQEEKIPLKNEKQYFKDIRQNSVVSSIFQRTGFKVHKQTKNTKHHTWTTIIFSDLSIMVLFFFHEYGTYPLRTPTEISFGIQLWGITSTSSIVYIQLKYF